MPKTRTTFYNKLVRDGIPQIIAKNGGVPKTRILSAAAYKDALLKKLVEEATEARDANGIEELMAELADVEEALSAILAAHNITPEQVEKLRKLDARKRGAFTEKIFLESVEMRVKSRTAK